VEQANKGYEAEDPGFQIGKPVKVGAAAVHKVGSASLHKALFHHNDEALFSAGKVPSY
jgi:hypothetical protein